MVKIDNTSNLAFVLSNVISLASSLDHYWRTIGGGGQADNYHNPMVLISILVINNILSTFQTCTYWLIKKIMKSLPSQFKLLKSFDNNWYS